MVCEEQQNTENPLNGTSFWQCMLDRFGYWGITVLLWPVTL